MLNLSRPPAGQKGKLFVQIRQYALAHSCYRNRITSPPSFPQGAPPAHSSNPGPLMRFLRLFPCLAVLTLTGLAAAPALPARPNIVFILSDDMGWNQLAINGGDRSLRQQG